MGPIGSPAGGSPTSHIATSPPRWRRGPRKAQRADGRGGAALPRDRAAAGGYKTHTPQRSHRSHRFRPLIAERDRKAELAKPGESDPETSPNVPVSAAPAIIEETRKPGDPASSTFFPSQRHVKALTLKREARGAQ